MSDSVYSYVPYDTTVPLNYVDEQWEAEKLKPDVVQIDPRIDVKDDDFTFTQLLSEDKASETEWWTDLGLEAFTLNEREFKQDEGANLNTTSLSNAVEGANDSALGRGGGAGGAGGATQTATGGGR